MSLARSLNVFAEFGVSERKVSPSHVDEVAQTSHNASVAQVKHALRCRITIVFGKAGMRGKKSRERERDPKAIGAEDAPSVASSKRAKRAFRKLSRVG